MELKLKMSLTNAFPLKGIVVKGSAVKDWLLEVQRMGLSLLNCQVFPLPGKTANTLWGCLVYTDFDLKKLEVGRNSFCQLVYESLFIPEKSEISPILNAEEVKKLLKGKKHFFHPETGLVELAESINWIDAIQTYREIPAEIKVPAWGVVTPKKIKSFQIKPVAPEEVLEQFEEKNFPIRQKFSDKPLSLFEKAKLQFYKLLFVKTDEAGNGDSVIKEKPLLSKLEKLKKLFNKKDDWADSLQSDFEELEKRNQKHLDRLLDLLKSNPQEALKYAIPLDKDGTSRGVGGGQFNMEKRWFDFSLFGDVNWGTGGSTFAGDDTFLKLHRQYNEAAEALIRQKEYQKAAFVYMKLLKDHSKAAQTMENASFYQEAASIYLKYAQNKTKAAECYEKGEMTLEAIELYKELGQNEKVGDLYSKIHKKTQAYEYYRKVVESYKLNSQYVKASLLCKNKMHDRETAQNLLLEGWRANKDSFNCLNNYFSNIANIKALGIEIKNIYQNDVVDSNRETFIQIIKHEFEKNNELSASLKEIAHELIVSQIPKNPSIVSELRAFNKKDKQLVKDTMRFRLRYKK